MPVYVYQCNTCADKYTEDELTDMGTEQASEAILFETYHTMEASKKELAAAVVCPRCNGNDCSKSMLGVEVKTYMRGYGWRDTAGAKRDMHVYHLDNQDPYSNHRTPGEVDHIRSQLKSGGKHNPKSKVFTATKSSDNK